MSDPARWENREPANLAAAAADAQEWLALFRRNPCLAYGRLNPENARRFDACLGCLSRMLEGQAGE